MKIAIAQINYHIGNFDGNLQSMIKAINEAKEQKADIVLFGELSTCGYPPRDFLEFEDFIEQSEAAVAALLPYSMDIAILVGTPTKNPLPEGKDLFNSAYFLSGGKIIHAGHKALLPTYDIFDEYRYFEPATSFSCLDFKGKKIAITICEDIWNVGNDNPLYKVCPLDELIKERPDFVLNLSASPFSFSHAQSRIDVLRANVERYKIPMFYCNHVGAQTEIIFDGGSIVISPDGKIYDEFPYFQTLVKTYELDDVMKGGVENIQPKEKFELIRQALICGIKDYFEKLGFTKAVLGLSGGIDSALTCVLAAQALGAENVRGVLMPSQFSSDHSVNDAIQLAKNLGCPYDIIPIEKTYNALLETLAPTFEGQPFNLTEENLQARARGIIVMAISNKFGNILLNTSNKSEAAVGYGTLYGDMCGGISVLGDVYKTEVFELARWINKDKEIIPLNSIVKPPSAELRPNQKDSDSLPEYEILDPILYQYIENRKSPQDIIELGYDEKLVRRICRLVNINEFKRYQTPPMLRVSRKAFGMGRRLPIVAKYLN